MFTENSVTSNRILYTPSVFAKSTLIYLQEIGSLTAVKPHTSTRTNLTSYLFFVVLDGKGTLSFMRKNYSLQKGDCIFIDCKEAYSHSTDSGNLWTLKWVHFYGETLPGIYDKYLEYGGSPVFRPDNVEPHINILDLLFNTATSDDHLRDMKINELLSSLLTKIMEMCRQNENQASIRRGSFCDYTLHDIKDYLDENWAKKTALDELADKFYINKYYLMRLFKNQYGTSVINYIMNLRITHAKQQLRFSDKTVETIGMDCGFEDANYFSRAFKKIEGISPMEYRKTWVQ